MRRGDFTVIVARFAETPARKYSFSKKLVGAVSVALFVFLSSFILSSLHYYQMWKKTAEYDHLKVEVDQLRKENQSFRLATNNLGDQLSGLEMVSKKLSILSGLNLGSIGVGGPTSPPGMLNLSSQDLSRQLKSLKTKSGGLEIEFRRLQEFYTNRSILLAATPGIRPVHGYPSAGFGYRADPFSGDEEFHPGVDISAPTGTNTVSTADGLVIFADRQAGYGKLVVIQHRFGLSSRYGHLQQACVKVGQRVKKGDVIGYVGATGRATGPHLHYEVRLNGQPMNPYLFFRDNN
jgi:murein DD-endopeptidase MepM/ murein hydrolase activator NlpD